MSRRLISNMERNIIKDACYNGSSKGATWGAICEKQRTEEFSIGDRVVYIYSTIYIEGQIHEIFKDRNTAFVVKQDGTKYELELHLCKKINNYTK